MQLEKHDKQNNELENLFTKDVNLIEENNSNRKIKYKDFIRQIFACCLIYLPVIQVGVNMSYSAILLPQLANTTTSTIHVNKDEASWIASLVTISLPIGSFASVPLIDKFGRKISTILTCVPFIISWLLVATATNIYSIYIGRLLAGIGSGLSTVSLLYVGEISHTRLRPMVMSANSIFVSIGILTTGFLGLFCHWRTMALVYAGMCLISSILIIIPPESPYWYITFQNKNVGNAKKAYKWMYKDEQVFNKEFSSFLKDMQTKEVIVSRENLNKKIDGKFDIYFMPRAYKPLFILIGILFLQQLSGAYVIIFYAVDIFLKIGGNFGYVDEYGIFFLLGLLRFIMSIFTVGLSNIYGRRPLMMTSGIGMTLCILIGGISLHTGKLLFTNADQKISLILLICVLGFVLFSSIGFFVLPWALLGELLPMEVKGTLSGVLVAIAYMFMFGTVKAYPYAVDLISLQGLFYIFAMNSFLGVIFVYLYLPETFRKSFAEIESNF